MVAPGIAALDVALLNVPLIVNCAVLTGAVVGVATAVSCVVTLVTVTLTTLLVAFA